MDFCTFSNLVICLITRSALCPGRGTRCRHSWTLRFPDPEGLESVIPFPRRRTTFSVRDEAHEAVHCPFAKEIGASFHRLAERPVCHSAGGVG